MSLRHLITSAILAAFPVSLMAQADGVFDDHVTPERYRVEDSSWCGLGVNVDANFFFKNNEYFAPYIEGYTLIGYQLRPTVGWRIHPKIVLTGGLQAMMYGGLDNAHYVRPHFAALWKANDWLSVQMGSLPGVASHPAHEAMQDPEGQITEKPELGLQLWISRPKLKGSVWLNWRQFIFIGDTIPERFSAGASMLFAPTPAKSGASFEMPFVLIFNHIGGQISDYPQKMQSLANVSVAPSLVVRSSSWSFVQRLALTVHALGFHTMAGSEVRPFADGYALSPELSLKASYLQAALAFYHAHNYYAPHGNPLLSSLSNYDDDCYSENRNMLTFSASFVKAISRVARFSVDAKGYLDTDDSRLDYSYGMTMVLTPGLARRHAPIRHEYAPSL